MVADVTNASAMDVGGAFAVDMEAGAVAYAAVGVTVGVLAVYAVVLGAVVVDMAAVGEAAAEEDFVLAGGDVAERVVLDEPADAAVERSLLA